MEITSDIFNSPIKYKKSTIRNPVINIDGFKIGIIGDPHIGKSFRTGVPKHRLGEREQMIRTQLSELLNSEVDVVVVVGDLFDKIRVSNMELYGLLDMIVEAVQARPNTKFYILNGNHDMPKEKDRISSFQLLEKYFEEPLDNLHIVSKHSASNILTIDDKDLTLYFSHYNAFQSLDDELDTNEFSNIKSKYKIAFGHWEVTDFGSDHFIDRVIPKIVKDNFNLIVTGHEHKPKVVVKAKEPTVIVTGSMQPYAYGEELASETKLYVTMPCREVVRLLKLNPKYFINSYVRIVTKGSDELPDDFDCLGRIYKQLPPKQVEDNISEIVSLDEAVSFTKAFSVLVNNYVDANPTKEDFLRNIERIFTDKSYKENS